MMFQKRHYETLSQKIGQANSIEELVWILAEYFGQDNERFDSDRWFLACGQ